MFLGLDIGGTTLRAALYDAQWRTVSTHTHRLRQDAQGGVAPQDLIALIQQAHHTLCAEQPAQAIGVGLAAQMDARGEHVHNAPNLGWRDVPFAHMLTQHLGQPVRLVNDLNALLMGEAVGGSVCGLDDVLAVYVGTGVGGAILSGGRLIQGAGGVAAELGHVKVDPYGRLCGCGERGCLEAYVGGIHLERQIAQLAGGSPWRARITREDGSVDLALADALSREVPAIKALWQRSAGHLALCIANAMTLLNPQAVLLGGGVLTHCPHLKDAALKRALPLVLAAARHDLQVVFASRDDAGMLGAAHLAAQA